MSQINEIKSGTTKRIGQANQSKIFSIEVDDKGNAAVLSDCLPSGSPTLLREEKVEKKKKEERSLVLTVPQLAKPKKLKNKKGSRGTKALLPPPFDATTRTDIHRRFRANSAGTSTVISMGAIFGSLGVTGTVTNTTCVSMYSSFRLNRITIWPPQNSGADRTILEWGASADGGYSPDSAFINTIPDGITETTGITFRPPAKSLLNNWMSTYLSASNIIAYMTCPVGTIIDLHVTACMPNDFVPESITVAAATVGSIYYLALDGPTTNNFIPVGLITTH
jgi:hypothetical protein